jgi:3-oxoacyl-[acyl-carrier protein] reductase
VTAAAADALAASEGVVVNVSSMTAYGPGAVQRLRRQQGSSQRAATSLADELGSRGVRVVGIAPGFVATDTVLAGMAPGRPKALLELQSIPTRGQPDDIATITHFLASPSARLVIGHTVVADAGVTRRP